MKKMILSLVISAVTLCSCGVNVIDGENAEKKPPVFAMMSKNVCENGMIFSKEPAMYIDFDTMQKTVLCAKPNCTHTTSECTAMLVGEAPLIYDGYIYYFTSSQKVEELKNGKREYRINSKLCRVSLDSSEVEELVTFTDCVPRDYDGWCIYDGKAWFTGDDMNPTEDGYGAITAGNCGGTHFMCSIDLKTKEYTNYGSVYDGDKEYEAAANSSGAQINGLRNGKFILCYQFATKESEIMFIEGQPIDLAEEIKRFKYLTFEFDAKTHELEQINEAFPLYADDDVLMYTYGEDITIEYKGKKFTLEAEPFDWSKTYFNGKVFDETNDKWYDLDDDFSEHSMGEYEDYTVVAFHDNSYFLKQSRTNEMIKLTEEELKSL